jgi:CheY-like chemotaxis protein
VDHSSLLDAPVRVLLAEDDLDLRAVLRELLTQQSYEVLSAGSGSEMLAMLSAAARGALPRPDVILSDVNMPGLSGLDLLRAVRLAGWTTPVVLMTAFPEERVYARAHQHGAFALLEKPLAAARLLTVLSQALGRAAA